MLGLASALGCLGMHWKQVLVPVETATPQTASGALAARTTWEMAFDDSQGDDKQFKEEKGQKELERGLYLLGANITSWSTKARTFMQGECAHDVVMMVDHRQRNKVKQLRKDLYSAGWDATVTTAVPGPT